MKNIKSKKSSFRHYFFFLLQHPTVVMHVMRQRYATFPSEFYICNECCKHLGQIQIVLSKQVITQGFTCTSYESKPDSMPKQAFEDCEVGIHITAPISSYKSSRQSQYIYLEILKLTYFQV
jgi:hypothetical protein